MVRIFRTVVLAIFCKLSADGNADLTPEAITVYRNPDFFKNLNYNTQIIYTQKPTKLPEEKTHGIYKYPGETKKPNPPPTSPGFEINYDNSSEFHHEPREIFVDVNYKPRKKKGPYSPIVSDERYSKPGIRKPAQGRESEEESKGSKESLESGEEPRDFVSVFNENPDEEFGYYHEPSLLAKPNFDPARSSGFAGSTYQKPYQYNRTRPILYEDWKLRTYPKIYAKEHLQSDPKLYSEEPSSNSSEDEPSSYYTRDDETEDASNFFETDEFRNLGADTKHIYKKLLNPKKSFLFKFHSKPKFKKLKLKLKKTHLHNTDWFNEYPFNF